MPAFPIDDRRAAVAAMATAATMLAHQIGGRAIRDALFLSHFKITTLSALIVASALISAAVALPWSRLLWREGPDRAVPRAFLVSAVLMLAIWALSFFDSRSAAIATYLHTVVMGPVLASGFWSLVGERFDVRTAKRTIGRLAGVGTLGGIAGGVMADTVSGWAGATAMLPLLAVLHFACAGLVRGVIPPPSPRAAEPRVGGNLLAGIHALTSRPYLRSLGGLVLVGAAGAALLEYAFKARAAEVAHGSSELVRLFALFHSAVAVLTFLLQVLFSRYAIERAGLARTVATQPLALMAGGAVAALMPGLSTAFIARGGESVLRGSLFRSGYQILFSPIPIAERRATKSLVDIALDRIGEAGGGVLTALLVIVAGAAAPVAMLWTAVVFGAVGTWLSMRLHRGYVGELESGLVSGAYADEPPGMSATEMADLSGGIALDQTQSIRISDLGRLTHPPSRPAPREPEPVPMSPGDDLLTVALDRASLGLPPPEPPGDENRDLDPPPERPAVPATPIERAEALSSRDVARVRAALVDPLTPALVPHVVPLVGRADLAGDALHALRGVAPQVTGQLTDALLDPELALDARRRIARLLGTVGTPRAIEGLLAGLEEPRFAVRHACGLALARLRERSPDTEFDPDRIFTQVHREVEVERHVWTSQLEIERLDDPSPSPIADAYLRERASASLQHVFNLLALVLPQQPLQVAFRGLHGEDRMLRGMALEYLESVLPPPIRARLWPFLEEDANQPPSTRSRTQILGDLMTSHDSIRIHISELGSELGRESPPE